MEHRQAVRSASKRYERTEAAHEAAREAVVSAVLAALRDGEPPTDVADWSPFTEAYVRKLARTNGIPEYAFRRFRRSRAWMDEHCANWPDVAHAIGSLEVGLNDAEYVGGVIYLGLTHKGAEHDVAQQRRMIADRLVRWATRDNDGEWRTKYSTTTALADAVDDVLTRHLTA